MNRVTLMMLVTLLCVNTPASSSVLTLGEAYKIEPAAAPASPEESKKVALELAEVKRMPIDQVTTFICIERDYHEHLARVPHEKLAEGSKQLEGTVRRLRQFKFIPRRELRPIAATYPILNKPEKLLSTLEIFLRDVLIAMSRVSRHH